MIKALDQERVLLIHSQMLHKYGGIEGIRDEELLDSAINTPFQTFGGIELYPTLFDKAARLGYGLIKNHPFLDANKRTGTGAILVFLMINGINLNFDDDDLINLIYKVADDSIDYYDLLKWLKEHVSSTKV